MDPENENVQVLDDVTTDDNALSDEQDDASEKSEEKERVMWREDEEEETTDDTPETDDKGDEPEKPTSDEKQPEKKYTDAELKSHVDKQTAHLNEVHTRDLARFDEVVKQRNELRKENRKLKNEGDLKSLFQVDISDGMEEEQAKKVAEKRKQVFERLDEYEDNVEQVTDSKEVIELIRKNWDQELVSKYGLDDPNPYSQAVNFMNAKNEIIGEIKELNRSKDAFEVYATKGTPLRADMDKFVLDGVSLSDDAWKMACDKKGDELRITPKSGPPKPIRETQPTKGRKPTYEELRDSHPDETQKKVESGEWVL